MADQDNEQVARQTYAAFVRGDIAGVTEHFADDIEWAPNYPAALPWAGTRRGKAAAAEFFPVLGQHIEFQRFDPHTFIAQGDMVVVLVHSEGTMLGSGRQFTYEEAQVATYRAGKMARFQTYGDPAVLVAAYRGE